MNDKNKQNAKVEEKRFALACVMIIVGIVLLFLGFYADPIGVISASVLSGTGELLFFAGCLLSLDSYVNFKINKLFNDKEKKE